MPEKKIKVELPGVGPVDAVEVAVAESTERWTDVKLEDGSVLRLKSVIIGAIRVEGRYDQDGNPMYSLRANQVLTVSAPDHLRKGGTSTPKGVQ